MHKATKESRFTLQFPVFGKCKILGNYPLVVVPRKHSRPRLCHGNSILDSATADTSIIKARLNSHYIACAQNAFAGAQRRSLMHIEAYTVAGRMEKSAPTIFRGLCFKSVFSKKVFHMRMYLRPVRPFRYARKRDCLGVQYSLYEARLFGGRLAFEKSARHIAVISRFF